MLFPVRLFLFISYILGNLKYILCIHLAEFEGRILVPRQCSMHLVGSEEPYTYMCSEEPYTLNRYIKFWSFYVD